MNYNISGMRKIAIIDYGVGNLYSLQKALKKYCDAVLTEEADEILSADAIVLPGDGAFHAGMKGLEVRGLTRPLLQKIASGSPVLGICLGAQILLSKGFEYGEWDGLNIITGKVVRFPKGIMAKIPHINWSPIVVPPGVSWEDTILKSVPQGSQAYFVHSFIIEPDDPAAVLAFTEYGGHEFCSVIKSGNVYGCQFHPEKSGEVGLSIIKNFVDLI